MALQTKTETMFPITFTSGRLEILLHEGSYLSDSLTLLNFGMFAAGVALGNDVGLMYPITNGVGQAISRATLKSGSTIIEDIDRPAQMISARNMNTDQETSEDIKPCTLRSGWMLTPAAGQNLEVVNNTDGPLLTLTSPRKDYFTTFHGGIQPAYPQSRMGANQDPTTSSGSIKLKTLFGLLRATTVLPNIPDLRVIIEYDTDITHYYQTANSTAPASILPTLPFLVGEKVMNPEQAPRVTTIPYLTTLCDAGMIVTAAPTAGVTYSQSYQSYTFEGQILKDLLLYAQPQAGDGVMVQSIRSPGQGVETINFTINNTKYLPYQGIDTAAKKLQYLTGSLGEHSIPLISTVVGMTNPAAVTDAGATSICGGLSLTAIKVDAPIKALQIDYSRTTLPGATNAQTQSFAMLMYGRVAKTLTIADGVATVAVAG